MKQLNASVAIIFDDISSEQLELGASKKRRPSSSCQTQNLLSVSIYSILTFLPSVLPSAFSKTRFMNSTLKSCLDPRFLSC